MQSISLCLYNLNLNVPAMAKIMPAVHSKYLHISIHTGMNTQLYILYLLAIHAHTIICKVFTCNVPEIKSRVQTRPGFYIWHVTSYTLLTASLVEKDVVGRSHRYYSSDNGARRVSRTQYYPDRSQPCSHGGRGAFGGRHRGPSVGAY